MPDEELSIKTKAEFQKALADSRQETFKRLIKALYKGATECSSVEDCIKHYETVGLTCNYLGDLLAENGMSAEWEKTWYNTLLDISKGKFQDGKAYAEGVKTFIKKVTNPYYSFAAVTESLTEAERK